MKISQKLILSFIAVFLLAAAVGGIGIIGLGRVSTVLDRINENWLPMVQHTSAMKSSAIDYRNRETQLLVTHSPEEISETLGRMGKNFAALQAEEQAAAPLLQSSDEKALFQAYQTKRDAYLETHRNFEAMVRTGKMTEALAYFRGDARKAFRDLLPTIDKLVEHSTAGASQAREEASKLSAAANRMMIGVTLAALVASLGLSYWLFQSIIPHLRRISETTAAMAQNSDFTLRVDIASRDEVGETAESVNRVAMSIRDTLRELLQGISHNAETAGRLSQAASQVSGSSARQADAASSMAATVEELTVSINQVADSARQAFDLSHKSGEAAREGGTVIADSVRQMKEIAARIRQTAGSVEQLGQASQDISGIVQVIKEVADQTNLLALNAAIEAARAGEQGRGFAVVADEVRKLAERTSMATQDISSKITGIRSGVDSATASMDEAVSLVETGVTMADSAGESVSLINRRTAEVESVVNTISDALREQGKASDQIAVHVEQIARMSEENNLGAEDTAALSRDLATLADAMRKAAERFRV